MLLVKQTKVASTEIKPNSAIKTSLRKKNIYEFIDSEDDSKSIKSVTYKNNMNNLTNSQTSGVNTSNYNNFYPKNDFFKNSIISKNKCVDNIFR